jgi:hypothetical protein
VFERAEDERVVPRGAGPSRREHAADQLARDRDGDGPADRPVTRVVEEGDVGAPRSTKSSGRDALPLAGAQLAAQVGSPA